MSKRFSLIVAMAIAAASVPTEPLIAQEGLSASDDPTGYFLGVSVGQSMTSQGFQKGDFDPKVFALGLADALDGKDPSLTDEQLREVQQKIQSLLVEREEKMQSQQQQKSVAWMKQNAEQEGVKTLEGGVQYKVLTAGKGASPSPRDTVRVHYTGKLIDGEVFDSSVERGEPASFQVGQVIKGWQMALQQMKVGDKWMLYIPPELAYGERGAPPRIGPNEVLVFEVELLDIVN